MDNIYDIPLTRYDGEDLDLKQFENSVLLIINIASDCSYSEQLTEVKELMKRYEDEGLNVLFCPSQTFTPSNFNTVLDEVHFYKNHYYIEPHFMTDYLHVSGDNIHPLFKLLTEEKTKKFRSQIKWNCTKFLISRSGEIKYRFAPKVRPLKMEPEIKELLKEN